MKSGPRKRTLEVPPAVLWLALDLFAVHAVDAIVLVGASFNSAIAIIKGTANHLNSRVHTVTL